MKVTVTKTARTNVCDSLNEIRPLPQRIDGDQRGDHGNQRGRGRSDMRGGGPSPHPPLPCLVDQRGAAIRPGKWVAVRGDVADLSFNSAHRGVTIRGAWRSEIRGRGRSPAPTSRFTAGASEMRGRGRSPHPHLSLHGRGVRDVGARALPTPPPLASRQGLRGSRQELRAFENAESESGSLKAVKR